MGRKRITDRRTGDAIYGQDNVRRATKSHSDDILLTAGFSPWIETRHAPSLQRSSGRVGRVVLPRVSHEVIHVKVLPDFWIAIRGGLKSKHQNNFYQLIRVLVAFGMAVRFLTSLRCVRNDTAHYG